MSEPVKDRKPIERKFVVVNRHKEDKSSPWYYFLKEENGDYAQCNHKKCGKLIKIAGGSTTGMREHLKRVHLLDLQTEKQLPKEPANQLPTVKSYFKPKTSNLSEILARMAAKDGLSFYTISKSEDIRLGLVARGFSNIPKSANTVKALVTRFSRTIREVHTNEINSSKFSVTIDEWTSVKRRRYLNVTLHDEGIKFWNLGLSPIRGPFTAERGSEVLKSKLSQFNLSFSQDIVAFMSDGPSVMVKLAKIAKPVLHQLCFAHGIQLAVIDVLYVPKPQPDETENFTFVEGFDEPDCDEESDTEIENDEDSQTILPEIISHRKETIEKIRKIVKTFRRPLKNETLQKHVKIDHGNKELNLILDCKTRWNSLAAMMTRFVLLKTSIQKALIDIGSVHNVEDWEWDRAEELVAALQPVERVVEALCRRDATLITADAAFQFLFNQLEDLGTSIAQELDSSVRKRFSERRTLISGVLKYLHLGTLENNVDCEEIFHCPRRKEILEFLIVLLTRFGASAADQCSPEVSVFEDAEPDPGPSKKRRKRNKDDLQHNLDSAIKDAVKNTHKEKLQIEPKCLSAVIKQEMRLFENGNKRGYHLTIAYNSLLKIKPTSVESERVFSACGYLCNTTRSRMSDSVLDELVFLRSYFQHTN